MPYLLFPSKFNRKWILSAKQVKKTQSFGCNPTMGEKMDYEADWKKTCSRSSARTLRTKKKSNSVCDESIKLPLGVKSKLAMSVQSLDDTDFRNMLSSAAKPSYNIKKGKIYGGERRLSDANDKTKLSDEADRILAQFRQEADLCQQELDKEIEEKHSAIKAMISGKDASQNVPMDAFVVKTPQAKSNDEQTGRYIWNSDLEKFRIFSYDSVSLNQKFGKEFCTSLQAPTPMKYIQGNPVQEMVPLNECSSFYTLQEDVPNMTKVFLSLNDANLDGHNKIRSGTEETTTIINGSNLSESVERAEASARRANAIQTLGVIRKEDSNGKIFGQDSKLGCVFTRNDSTILRTHQFARNVSNRGTTESNLLEATRDLKPTMTDKDKETTPRKTSRRLRTQKVRCEYVVDDDNPDYIGNLPTEEIVKHLEEVPTRTKIGPKPGPSKEVTSPKGSATASSSSTKKKTGKEKKQTKQGALERKGGQAIKPEKKTEASSKRSVSCERIGDTDERKSEPDVARQALPMSESCPIVEMTSEAPQIEEDEKVKDSVEDEGSKLSADVVERPTTDDEQQYVSAEECSVSSEEKNIVAVESMPMMLGVVDSPEAEFITVRSKGRKKTRGSQYTGERKPSTSSVPERQTQRGGNIQFPSRMPQQSRSRGSFQQQRFSRHSPITFPPPLYSSHSGGSRFGHSGIGKRKPFVRFSSDDINNPPMRSSSTEEPSPGTSKVSQKTWADMAKPKSLPVSTTSSPISGVRTREASPSQPSASTVDLPKTSLERGASADEDRTASNVQSDSSIAKVEDTEKQIEKEEEKLSENIESLFLRYQSNMRSWAEVTNEILKPSYEEKKPSSIDVAHSGKKFVFKRKIEKEDTSEQAGPSTQRMNTRERDRNKQNRCLLGQLWADFKAKNPVVYGE